MSSPSDNDSGESGLDPESKVAWLKALSAFEVENYQYASDLLKLVLSTCPNFKSGHELLNAAQQNLAKQKVCRESSTDWECPLCGHIIKNGFVQARGGDRVTRCPKCEFEIDV